MYFFYLWIMLNSSVLGYRKSKRRACSVNKWCHKILELGIKRHEHIQYEIIIFYVLFCFFEIRFRYNKYLKIFFEIFDVIAWKYYWNYSYEMLFTTRVYIFIFMLFWYAFPLTVVFSFWYGIKLICMIPFFTSVLF